ncbi:MAG TPA: bifunctional nuclease family protein [Armatimonadota bacterium]|nr:bifunctional nuclease family protein [Armatimonadota bacterium]HOS42825.1 bifunctional nuclease family protein [Armatimonadota bacterium]
MADIPVEIWELVRDEQDRDIVLLRDERGRLLPIVIGVCEAMAIWVRLKPDKAGVFVRRPWAHDLMQAMLERLGARLERVVIDGLVEGTFFATLQLTRGEEEIVADARPSDAIALLLRMNAALFVNDEVMEEASIKPDADDEPPEIDPWGELPE